MNRYDFKVTGTSFYEQTWTTTGTVFCAFDQVFTQVVAQSFQKLTAGKAIFGQPGVGCEGPYQVKTLWIERREK